MKNKLGIGFCIIGILFIINAIFGRYIVLPGYLETLNVGNTIPENISVIKIVRYMLWAYSFKLGMFFFVLGVLLKNNRQNRDIILFSIISIIYIGFAYMPLTFRLSLFFGITGSIITIASLILFWIKDKKMPEDIEQNNIFEYLGLYFIVMGIRPCMEFIWLSLISWAMVKLLLAESHSQQLIKA
jgi:hypothetical protein